jgi:hypothetical protein
MALLYLSLLNDCLGELLSLVITFYYMTITAKIQAMGGKGSFPSEAVI